MNFLAHLLLSDNTHEARIGSLLADFTNISNSSLTQYFSPDVSNAVIVHRQIDQYTDSHQDVTSSVQYFFPKYRHCSRIIVDILFDHFLSVHWNNFCAQPLDSFVESMYKTLRKLPEGMPQRFTQFIPNLIRYDLLRAYLTMDDLREVFSRVDNRFKTPVGLHNAVAECIDHYEELDNLFLHFFPDLLLFSNHS
jgi:acyl carrier protein phosphodiesterase